MFVHMAVHFPKPDCAEKLLASMHKVDAAAREHAGLVQIGAWRDARTDRLIGLAIWESREAFEAAHGAIFAVVADDPLDEWWTAPPDVPVLPTPPAPPWPPPPEASEKPVPTAEAVPVPV